LEIASCFLPTLAWTSLLLLYTSHCGWGERHTPLHPATGWDEVAWTFCPHWPQTTTLLLSASFVARITDVSHWQPAHHYLFYHVRDQTQVLAQAGHALCQWATAPVQPWVPAKEVEAGVWIEPTNLRPTQAM
jgi:hypothetical protein